MPLRRSGRCVVAAQLLGRLDQQEQSAHAGMTRRQATAVGVGGQLAAQSQPAVGDERSTVTFGAEPEVLEGEQQHAGEGVVDAAQVDVIGRHPGALQA